MSNEHRRRSSRHISSFLLPWIVAGSALVLYLVTLNFFVTFSSMPVVVQAAGWDWRPTVTGPLYYLFTFPVRWFPPGAQIIVLNVFSAVCAALTLALLARSVSLLPQDRTRDQRHRMASEDGRLNISTAWVPPVLAVVAMGLQLTFWEHATVASREIFDLLLFAYVIRCLLEYRISEKESWLMKMALVYGLAVTNNWAMIGFFPFFLGAVIWIKGLSFFRPDFLLRMTGLGLLGLSLYLLLPLIASMSPHVSASFWEILRAQLSAQKNMLVGIPRWLPLVLAMTTLVPVIFMGIRWPSFHGDMNPLGAMLGRILFRGIHVAFLILALWMFFDYKFSPRILEPRIPFLSFYYLAALAVGYFSGYVLVVFGREPANPWERAKPPFRQVHRAIAGLVLVALAAVPAALLYRNWSDLRVTNGPIFEQFAKATAEGLPEEGAVVLSDDPMRLFFLQASQGRLGRKTSNLLIETTSLPFRNYHKFLQARHPELQEMFPLQEVLRDRIDDVSLLQLMIKLDQSRTLYYLHPSYGYYFEVFHPQPRGLVYELKRYPDQQIEAPPPDDEVIARNNAFWNQLKASLDPLPAVARGNSQVKHLSSYYSKALNYWGTELQKQNRLPEAQAMFAEALRLNRDNAVAEVNQRFNLTLQKGKVEPVQMDAALSKRLEQYRSLEGALNINGPFDELAFNFRMGQIFARAGNLRQGAQNFLRVLEFKPNDVPTQIALIRTYIDLRQPQRALELIDHLREPAQAVHLNITNQFELLTLETIAYVSSDQSDTAEKILLAALEGSPRDENSLRLLSQFYVMTGNTTNALAAIDRQLQINPGDAFTQLNKAALFVQDEQFDKAHAVLDDILKRQPANIPALLYKSDIHIILKEHEQALAILDRVLKHDPKNITALIKIGGMHITRKQYKESLDPLTEALRIQPQNGVALFNRAIAHLQSDNLSAAQRDYEMLLPLTPRSFPVYYGLGEIAYRKKDYGKAIEHYELYLKFAPADSSETKMIRERLADLKRSRS
jgi:tetratricopeptide (TPR) repeat protein